MNKFQARFIESVLKKVEMYGSGFKKVFSSCNANGIKFSYESNDDGFSFVFYRNDVTFFKFNESKHHVFIKGVHGASQVQMEGSHRASKRLLRSLFELGGRQRFL